MNSTPTNHRPGMCVCQSASCDHNYCGGVHDPPRIRLWVWSVVEDKVLWIVCALGVVKMKSCNHPPSCPQVGQI